jgi:hypothetical protein
VKGIATNVPTDLYPEYGWDSLALRLWPIPSYAYGLRLELWVGLTQFQEIANKFSAPPAWFNFYAYTLAVALVGAYELPMPATLPSLLREATKAVQTNTIKSRRIASADWGTRGGSGSNADFNYMSGGPPSWSP